MSQESLFRVLTLDGGGAKGVYTLGFLRELEAACRRPLSEVFDAVYGTSTGAIIAALIGLGHSATQVLELYKTHVPGILKPRRAKARSEALQRVADELFQQKTFADFKTFVGIVVTNCTGERPLVFKSSVDAAYSMRETFAPGFGCTISKVVQASCSATPFFLRRELDLKQAGKVEAIDGGFCANNPTLFAVTDALGSFAKPMAAVRILSAGVGHYPEPKRSLLARLLNRIPTAQLLQKTLSVNAATTEILVKLLFKDLQVVRVSESFSAPEMATDLLEHREQKLNLLVQKGRDSYSRHEEGIRTLLEI